MAISRIGSATGTNSCTLPTHQVGDLILIFAYRDGSNTAPTLPSDYTNITSNGANTNSLRVGYKIAESSGEVSGTWTNATSLIAGIYRADTQIGIGNFSVGGAANTTFSYTGFTLNNATGTSWLVAGVGIRAGTTSNVDIAPSGLTNVTSVKDATDCAGLHDSNGTKTTWTTQTQATGAASTGWRTAVIEITENASPSVFGYNSIGGTENPSVSNDTFSGSKFTTNRGLTIDDLNVYTRSAGSNLRFAIYDGTPTADNLLWSSASNNSVSSTAAWYSESGVNFHLDAGTYWLFYWCDGTYSIYADAGLLNQAEVAFSNSFPTWENPMDGANEGFDSVKISIYANITYDGGTSPISCAIAGTSSVSGSVAAKGYISSLSEGTSNVNGQIIGIASVLGESNGSNSVSGSIGSKVSVSGQINGTSTATGTLSATIFISGLIQGTSTATAVTNNRVRGEANGTSTVSGSVSGIGYILGLVEGSSYVSGVLYAQGRLIGEGVGTSNVSGNLIGYGAILGTISGTSTVGGSLINFERRRYFIIS